GLAFWPSGSGVWVLPAITLAALVGVNWWASWYPGAEPGGGGYVVQNIAATRSEREGRAAALYFNIAHYAIRSWPWVITALCSLVLYGGAVKAEDPGVNYVQVTVDLLTYILRWYWWRINAWSEVSAMTAALVTSLTLRLFIDSSTAAGFALNLIVTTVITTIVWLIVTFATKPEPEETLQSFYRRARPAGR